MSFANLTITRDDIDGYEGVTFASYSSSTALSLADNDDLVLGKAKKELRADILDYVGNLYRNGDFDSETDLLDTLDSVDDQDLLKELLTLKFLSVWFLQDAQSKETLSYDKFITYHQRYKQYLSINMGRITSKLDKPRSTPRFQLNHTYG